MYGRGAKQSAFSSAASKHLVLGSPQRNSGGLLGNRAINGQSGNEGTGRRVCRAAMTADQEPEAEAPLALHRRAIVRALASSPVILTISGTAARAQQSFGTSLCPEGLRMLISDPELPPGERSRHIEACKNQL